MAPAQQRSCGHSGSPEPLTPQFGGCAPYQERDALVSRTYACGIAQVVAWGGEATVRAITAPLTLEEALAQLAQHHVGEIGRVLRLPAALPELRLGAQG
jgi:hypothetical protein